MHVLLTFTAQSRLRAALFQNRKTKTVNSEPKTTVLIWFDIAKKTSVSVLVLITVTTLVFQAQILHFLTNFFLTRKFSDRQKLRWAIILYHHASTQAGVMAFFTITKIDCNILDKA